MKKLLIVAVILTGCKPRTKDTGTEPTKTSETTSPAPTRPTKTERKPQPESKKPEAPAVIATAASVREDYKTNELKAKATYLGQRVRVVGMVTKVTVVGKGVHVVLGVGPGANVTMKFTRPSDQLAELQPNEAVVIDGTGDGTVLSNPLFRDCELKASGFTKIDEAFAKGKELDQ